MGTALHIGEWSLSRNRQKFRVFLDGFSTILADVDNCGYFWRFRLRLHSPICRAVVVLLYGTGQQFRSLSFRLYTDLMSCVSVGSSFRATDDSRPSLSLNLRIGKSSSDGSR